MAIEVNKEIDKLGNGFRREKNKVAFGKAINADGSVVISGQIWNGYYHEKIEIISFLANVGYGISLELLETVPFGEGLYLPHERFRVRCETVKAEEAYNALVRACEDKRNELTNYTPLRHLTESEIRETIAHAYIKFQFQTDPLTSSTNIQRSRVR